MTKAPIALALLLATWVAPAWGQPGPRLTVNPSMTKGPAAAAVTIFEFSDYQ